MNILAIDTSTEAMGIGLELKNGNRIFVSSQMGLQHATQLLPWIDHLLEKGEITVKDLDLIVCATGPGSFTGLRIGLSTAKGIAFGKGIPLKGIPTLDALAASFPFYNGIVAPVIDARKKRLYTALFKQGKRLTEDLDISPEEFYTLISSHPQVLLTGSMAGKLQHNGDLDPGYGNAQPLNLLDLGKKRFQEEGGDPDTLAPIYLRKSEAEILMFGE